MHINLYYSLIVLILNNVELCNTKYGRVLIHQKGEFESRLGGMVQILNDNLTIKKLKNKFRFYLGI